MLLVPSIKTLAKAVSAPSLRMKNLVLHGLLNVILMWIAKTAESVRSTPAARVPRIASIGWAKSALRALAKM